MENKSLELMISKLKSSSVKADTCEAKRKRCLSIIVAVISAIVCLIFLMLSLALVSEFMLTISLIPLFLYLSCIDAQCLATDDQ